MSNEKIALSKPFMGAHAPKRGDCWIVDLGKTVGSVTNKVRPCIVVSEDSFNTWSTCVTIAPVTSSQVRRSTHVPIRYPNVRGTVMAEQMRTVSKEQLHKCVQHLSDEDMDKMDLAMAHHIFGRHINQILP